MSIHTVKQRGGRAAQQRADDYASVTDAYGKLPRDKREIIKAEYARQRAGNPGLSWGLFLAVALPLLPADAH